MADMSREILYSQTVTQDHLKKFGQYFTDYEIAEFMAEWACQEAQNMLDPAVGNSVFFKAVRGLFPDCNLFGFENDSTIINFFGNPTNATIFMADYLLSDWDQKYDAIVCNPPYSKFQSVHNRDDVIKAISEHTGVKSSGYTNLYIHFLIKSIFQMSDKGRIAYIIPTEFLNSKYGTTVKELLIKKKLLKCIVNFSNNKDLFFNATTTSCIMFLDRTPKDSVAFFNVNSISDLKTIDIDNPVSARKVTYSDLNPSEKWRFYLSNESRRDYRNLISASTFLTVKRGIATGANDFFCLSKSDLVSKKIPTRCVKECITRSADVESPFFTESEYEQLKKNDKKVFILDASENDREVLKEYIDFGVKRGIDRKYLPSCRSPWYSMEQKEIAPIWISSAYRGTIKVVRNLASVHSLTTFHLVYIQEQYKDYTNLLFCYLLTPTAQRILNSNRKELGNGLDKFQPNDINHAQMLDITKISKIDQTAIINYYDMMKSQFSSKCVEAIDLIISKYV